MTEQFDGETMVTFPTMIHRRTAIASAIAGAALACPKFALRAWARERPAAGRTGRIVVPFAAGGTADALGRVVARILNELTGSTYVIENWTGAGGNVSAEIVARAAPDGLTLLLGTLGTAVTNQYLYKNIPYDSEGSFVPVALVGEVTNVVVVHPSFPAGTLEEFVAYCKSERSGRVSYASPALGGTGHLSMEYLQDQAGIRLRHIAYGGRSRMIKDLLAGRTLIAMDNLPAYLRHIQSGELRALGVSSAKRWFAAPDVPSIAEQGYPDFEAALWWYIAAPAGTRRELVNKLSQAIVEGIGSETAIRKIRNAGASARPGNAEDLARHISAETIKWKGVIDAARLEPR
jgi:tripartite-type tricarboxylate transporter receptor subunit TctC